MHSSMSAVEYSTAQHFDLGRVAECTPIMIAFVQSDTIEESL
jgi:hypothetical protein